MSKLSNSKAVVLAILGVFGFGVVTKAKGQERKHIQPSTFEQLLEEMDSGKDDKLSAAEVKGHLKEIFPEIYANEDRYITKEEFENASKPERRRPNNND